jgi:hypothetical protein
MSASDNWNSPSWKTANEAYHAGRKPAVLLKPVKPNGSALSELPSPEDERAALVAGARPLTFYQDFDKSVALDWLVKNVLALSGCGRNASGMGSGRCRSQSRPGLST